MFGVTRPIIQAPMAGVQGSALAIAVSKAGGLGSLPCAMLTPAQIQEELQRLSAQTLDNGQPLPYNVNFFCHMQPVPDAARDAAWWALLSPYYAACGLPMDGSSGAARVPFGREHAEVLAHFKPPVVSFHFGLPKDQHGDVDEVLLAQVRSWGSKILCSATTVAEAKWLAARGVYGVIAQGLEAGGHRGIFLNPQTGSEADLEPIDQIDKQMGALALLPQIVRAVDVPVIAAGGFADAAGVRAAMALGASAVQVGTAYLLCPEATTSKVHRAALLGSLAGIDPQVTALTNLFTGRPARGIVNRLMRDLGSIHRIAPAFPLSTAALVPLRSSAEGQGLGDFTPLWAGQNTSGCQAISAADLTRQLAQGL